MPAAKKAVAKTASKPRQEPEPEPAVPAVDVRACCAQWHDAQRHIDAIDAQTGPDASLTAADRDRLVEQRAGHVADQVAAEKALA